MLKSLDTDLFHSQLRNWLAAPRWWLGLSGGLDSCVLLDLLLSLAERESVPPLTAIHVNHQLNPDAQRWAGHCQSICAARGVDLVCREVTVDPAGSGPEAAARDARYEVFQELVGADELLLMAHHLDDQVETFFLRLMRGAGPRGLAGMPAQRRLGAGFILRPLLPYTRQVLEQYAVQHSLAWIEDPSNSDRTLDRNFLRHTLLPVLEQRWPGYRSSVQSSMLALADTETALGDLDRAVLETAATAAFGEPVLDLGSLQLLPARELARLLRRWLEEEGLVVPGQSRLLEFARQLGESEPDGQPSLVGPGYELRRYRGRVHLSALASEDVSRAEISLVPGGAEEVPGVGRLLIVDCPEGGMSLPESGRWHIRFRSGGERCRPLGRARSQSLKKLLQESAVPPWLRERLPLLYDGESLAAVADLWVCTGHEARRPGAGYQLVWERNIARRLD